MNMAAHETKLIPVTLEDSGIKTCPNVGWYQFKSCTVKTCKNYTDRTESRCLALDREAPVGTKIISDSELHLFKFPKDGVSTRLVSMKRKRAISRVKCILALHGFIEYLQDKYGSTQHAAVVCNRAVLLDAESRYPLKVKRLEFENWMWQFIMSEAEYAEFASQGPGECAAFGLHELLDMKVEALEDLRYAVTRPTNPVQ